MKKITYLIVFLFLGAQMSFSQERYSRIKISQPTETTSHKITLNDIDLKPSSANHGATPATSSDYTLSGSQQRSHTDAWQTQSLDSPLHEEQSIKLRFSETTSSESTTVWSSDIPLDNSGITSYEVTTPPPPVAECQNIDVYLDASGNAVIVAADVDGSSTDDVTFSTYAIDIDTFNCSNLGTPVDVTLTVTNGNNQTDTCVAIITVLDQINPEFVNIPSSFILTCGNNQPTWTDPTITDNCSTGLIPNRTDLTGLTSGDVFPSGMTTISYSANDGNGNTAIASFTVNVVPDTENPDAICQNILVQLDATGNATISATQINNNSTDSCGIETVVASQTLFTCADEGTNNVTLTVTDTSGNIDTCTAVVTITLQDEPTAVDCWDDYQFNNTSCTWENQGAQPIEPTELECWETASFNDGTCLWEVSGTQPVEPAAVNCWDNYQFSNTSCTWENQGIAPIVPTGLNAGSITDISAIISWNAMVSFDFDLRYREVGASTWIDILDVMTNTQALTSLTPLTQYEVEVRSKCSGTETSGYSTTLTFVTLESEPSDYCDSESNGGSEEYISRVQLGDIDNVSGSQNYSDFTAISTVLRKGTQHTITITPTWSGTANNEAYSVWIDYNKDGDFDDVGEDVMSIAPTQDTSITGDFTIPASALDTKTRMRVTMKQGVAPTPCEIFDFGEVEDYTLIIVGSNDLIYTSSTWTPNAPSLSTMTDNVFVLDGTYNVTSDIQVNNMSVCVGAGIVVEKAIAMTVNGVLKTADNVVLESDSNEYASLLVENFVVGTAQYKRHVNAVASVGGSDLIAPPFYGESFIDFRADNPNLLSNTANTLFLFGPFDKISDIYLLYTNTETALLQPGIGYRAASTDAGTFTFTGDVKIGDLSVPVVNDGPLNPEWNLVGNPYPAYLSLSDFLAANSLQFETESSGVYGYDGFASDGWTIWNQGYSEANPNALIAPGQGFLIASATNNGQIEFTASMRRTGNADDFILGRQGNNVPISHLKLKLDNASNAYHTDFYFTENASLGQDPNYDSGLFGTAPALAIYSHLVEDNVGRNYGVQSIGSTNLSDVTIPLGINISAGQQATISITERSLPENVEVYLEDNLTNTFTLLNTTDYIFTANTNITGTGRFFISFAESTLLTESPEVNGINIFTTTQPKALYVKGQLLEDSELILFDLQGRLIRSWTLGSDKISHRIDASSLSAGVYFVTLKNDFQRITEKIVIK